MSVERVDVLIVGAGLSGIGAACHLQIDSPGKSYAILESREAMGGTWDLFRYPGIRSDSDMFTLGYDFRPWTEAKAIADGESIRNYIRQVAADYDVEEKIRYRHRVISAEWSSVEARWTVTAERTTVDGSVETVLISCSFLQVCAGYYRYDEGYTPEFAGVDEFAGQVVHPQHWPEDLDYTDKRVVIIGSGATAVTLVPSLAERAAHVTMLQRSPTYIISLPSKDPIADKLRRHLSPQRAYGIVRRKNVLVTMLSYQLSRRRPQLMKSILRRGVTRQLPEGYAVQTHFAPNYEPWDQRLCVVPDGDLFRAIRHGDAEIVTDRIVAFTKTGIKLKSGAELPADIVVTATGLNMLGIGGMTLSVDGAPVDLSSTLAYKGMMLSGVPNFALTIGYTNASWTLKADLIAHYVSRLLKYMDASGYQIVTPIAPQNLDPAELGPIIDLKSGYVLRAQSAWPKQGPVAPWRLYQNYFRDVKLLRKGSITDEVRFSRASAVPAQESAIGLSPFA
ncbi:catio diffusion facilitator CzcD-associated flavoprotein CzcO [Jatrophihabitans sp. GAS493]|uniref:flavin-containing monooxygenase n=1 Tax=Jatrophihabitans sp. GAS493 TaxID=1907575 RepID=UPI000BB7F40D|nr:NAD(P)/FAD-dependent oxidoreductase [Jatrophihabitans sp. GAS493]SOD74513.1 catio diffusion facilitator CzcD-associated flavoprotein CzcO [Jatrophihabitans sp. GAS493]